MPRVAVGSAVYRYTVGEQSWELDWFDLTLDECTMLRRVTGYRYDELVAEHETGDPLATKALLWMARRKAGEADLAFDDPSLTFSLRDFQRSKVLSTLEEKDPQPPTAPETAPADAATAAAPTKPPRSKIKSPS